MFHPSPITSFGLCQQQRGLGFCVPYSEPFSTTPFSLAACPWSDPDDSGLPLLLREPQGQLLSSAPSGSSLWKFVLWVLGFPDEEVEQTQGQ